MPLTAKIAYTAPNSSHKHPTHNLKITLCDANSENLVSWANLHTTIANHLQGKKYEFYSMDAPHYLDPVRKFKKHFSLTIDLRSPLVPLEIPELFQTLNSFLQNRVGVTKIIITGKRVKSLAFQAKPQSAKIGRQRPQKTPADLFSGRDSKASEIDQPAMTQVKTSLLSRDITFQGVPLGEDAASQLIEPVTRIMNFLVVIAPLETLKKNFCMVVEDLQHLPHLTKK